MDTTALCISVIAPLVISIGIAVLGVIASYRLAREQSEAQTKELKYEMAVIRRIAKRDHLATLFRAYVDTVQDFDSYDDSDPVRPSGFEQSQAQVLSNHGRNIGTKKRFAMSRAAIILNATNIPELQRISEEISDFEKMFKIDRDNLIRGLVEFSKQLQNIPS